MTVSVVIPSHGLRGGLLERAIGSATALASEVVVVDDASADPVGTLCDRAGVRYVWLPENRGVAGAQNAGVAAVTGDGVLFLHSDDLLLALDAPGTRHPVLRGGQVMPASPDSGKDLLRHRGGVHISHYVFPTEVLRSHPFDERLRAWEDWDLLYRLACAGVTFEDATDPLVEVTEDADDRLVGSPAMTDGLVRLLEKHAIEDRAVRSMWQYKIARSYRRRGCNAEWRRWLLRSLRTEPWHPRRALMALRSK